MSRIAAERRVAAAFNRVGEAKAAQLPRISLTAGGSNVSSELIVLKDASSPIWSLGANLIAPIDQGGAQCRDPQEGDDELHACLRSIVA